MCLVSEVYDADLAAEIGSQAAWVGEEKTLWSCHHIRFLHTLEHACKTSRVKISYLFTSHDHIHHVCIQWEGNPLLLFSDSTMVDAHRTDKFQEQASHLQMGLRKGMAILIFYVVGNTHYQAVLIAEESVMNRGGRGENRLWKRVTLFFNRWLHRISRTLAVLGYEGIKKATPVVLHPKGKSSAHSL